MSGSIDLACISIERDRMVVLVRGPARGRRAELPWSILEPAAALEAAATRLARGAVGHAPDWLRRLGAYGGDEAHPSGHAISVTFVTIVASGTPAPEGHAWTDAEGRMPVERRQRRMVADAVMAVRDRMDLDPVAFHLLPPRFTLSQLQAVYEVLLERPIHKASFRRALMGASLVVATDEWTSEGRGRPAQRFRYAPKRGKPPKRPIRFEMLG